MTTPRARDTASTFALVAATTSAVGAVGYSRQKITSIQAPVMDSTNESGPRPRQACDSTCSWCARHFWSWLKGRMHSAQREAGRSGEGSFADAAATSIRPETKKADS